MSDEAVADGTVSDEAVSDEAVSDATVSDEKLAGGGLELDLPTGRLILGDPGELFGDARPLDVALPEGRFPVVAGPDAVRLVFGP